MKSLSSQFNSILKIKKDISLDQLLNIFKERSFGVLLVLLLAIPALPLPTGGLTHIFEIIAMFIVLQMIIGRKSIWLPKKWLDKNLSKSFRNTALPKIIRLISFVEKFARPRFSNLFKNRLFLQSIGLVCLIFIVAAFLAPPFSGLDTLPSLGVVIIGLSLIFEDLILTILGSLIGIVGLALVVALGKIVLYLF